MRVLMLGFDPARRARLRAELSALVAQAQVMECPDAGSAIFASDPSQLSLLLLDRALLDCQGLAWLTQWRRMASQAQLLVLDADPILDLPRLRHALLMPRVVGPPAGRSADLPPRPIR